MNLSAVDLNLLVVLEALLAERSVTAAARRLGLSQPAVSHALSRLRALLGDPLFVRAPGGLAPTARTEALTTSLARAMDAIRQSLAEPSFDPETSDRSFSIATADLGAFVLVPPLLERLAKSAPRVDVAVRSTPMETAERQLAEGSLDLAVVVSPTTRAGFYREPLFRERFVCVLRRGHPFERGKLTLDRYCAASHVLVAPRGTPGSPLDAELAELGRRRRVALSVPHFLVAPHVVARSDLVWTAPESMARSFAQLLPLVVRPLPLRIEGFVMLQLWHERHQRDPAHVWLRRQVAAAARGSGAAPMRGALPEAGPLALAASESAS